jgi:hypothetical protein
MIEEHLAIPFQTEVLGVAVTVSAVDIAEEGRVVAICSRGGNEQRISILDVPLPNPLPELRRMSMSRSVLRRLLLRC